MFIELFYGTYNNLKKYVFNSNLGVDFQIIMQYNKLCDLKSQNVVLRFKKFTNNVILSFLKVNIKYKFRKIFDILYCP